MNTANPISMTNGSETCCSEKSVSFLSVLPNANTVVTIVSGRIGNDYLIALAQAFEYLDRADRVGAEFHRAMLRFSAVRSQDEHLDCLVGLAKRRAADFQNVG